MIFKSPQTVKNSYQNVNKSFDLRLPRKLKFTNNPEYTNVDCIREKLRKNYISRHVYDPQLESPESKRYYQKVYKPNEFTYTDASNDQKISSTRNNPSSLLGP